MKSTLSRISNRVLKSSTRSRHLQRVGTRRDISNTPSSTSMAVQTNPLHWDNEDDMNNGEEGLLLASLRDPDRRRNTCTCQPTEKEYIGARRAESFLVTTHDKPPLYATAAAATLMDAVEELEEETSEIPEPYPCGSPQHEDDFGNLPPPLPKPSYSVYKRVLPVNLTAMSSVEGREMLLQALNQKTAESYWSLMEQFVNQSDPAFCGVTTLLMALNAMGIDPNVRWRGGWRFFATEEVLLDGCCLSAERIRRAGLTLEEFRLMARCRGLSVELKRPIPGEQPDANTSSPTTAASRFLPSFTLEEFRQDIQSILTTPESRSLLVVSFSRSHLGQTGDGHFSPVAAYHEESDQVLVLDVARFKYAPYWVSIEDLYRSFQPKDETTKRSRGWFVLDPPQNQTAVSTLQEEQKEDRRPAEIVPLVGEPAACPIGKVKVEYCAANPQREQDN